MTPFRFVHSSDWQIGMKADHVGSVAPRVREARFEAARRVVELANEHKVDALVLSGDTFESTDVERSLVQRVVDVLRQCHAPVFVLPGNHDPLVARGVFEHPAWNDAQPLVRVLRSSDAIELGAALILPCPLTSRSSPEDPTDELATNTTPGRIRIGIAHGSLRGGPVSDTDLANDFPIDRANVKRSQLDYLALGHWHSPSQYEVEGVERIAYCGSHEPTKFGEQSSFGRSGQCLLVELDAPGATPRLTPLATAVLVWRQERRELVAGDDLARLRATLDVEDALSRTNTLLDLQLSGRLSPDQLGGLEDLAELASARFLYARLRSSELLLQPADDAWVDALPAGVPQAVARKLAQALSDPARARVARAALDLLYRLGYGPRP